MISVANNRNKNWGEKIQKTCWENKITIVNFPTLKKDSTNSHNVNKCEVFSKKF